MHGDITEPLDWFAADITRDDLTVPDWHAATPSQVGEWGQGAPTQPALSFDSAALAGPASLAFAQDQRAMRRAMGVYLLTTLLLLSLLCGMFFVWGGRFQSRAAPRLHRTVAVMAAASLPGQSVVQMLAQLPPGDNVPKPKPHKAAPSVKPPPPASITNKGDTGGSSLWPAVPPAPPTNALAAAVSPPSPIATPGVTLGPAEADQAAIPTSITQIPSSLWPTDP